jgi:7,8-dihydropterin-6-yl-methyl-4-(beta-D-ribofuranosyl)aminobenzene 5'-phosphate synthase
VIALKPLDSLGVDVLTDDVSDNYVSKTLFAVSEFANVILGGASVISGEALLCANLGFGLRLVSKIGDLRHAMLFDTGPEGAIFIRNCTNLGIRLGEIECIALTHGHWDHMAALPATIDAIVTQGGQVTVHVNPGMFNERAIRLRSGRIVPVAKVPLPAELEQHGATVVNDPEERLLLDGHFYYSGAIPRVSSFEKGRDDHLCRTSPEAAWEPDPLLMDERMLVAQVRGLGLIVLSACSHAGIVNVCTHVRSLYPEIPIYAVMGGLHLGGVMERIIPDTVQGLRPFNINHIITGHCTG